MTTAERPNPYKSGEGRVCPHCKLMGMDCKCETALEQPAANPVLDELVRDCADRVSRAVRVTGPPNMETCEDLPNAFAYWEKDSLHKIIRKTIDKAIAAKVDAVPRTPNLDDLATECTSKVINANPIKAREVIGDALLQCVVQYNPASWHIARALEKKNAQLESIADIVRAKRDEYRNALEKINELRNSMVAMQGFNFSEHLYPLVATLNAVGLEGADYPEALENFGTMLERTNKAQAESKRYRAALEDIASKPCANCFRDIDAQAALHPPADKQQEAAKEESGQ